MLLLTSQGLLEFYEMRNNEAFAREANFYGFEFFFTFVGPAFTFSS